MGMLIIQGAEEKRLGIHYEVDPGLDPIGVGGMGQVFKGFRVDEKTNIRDAAAIKFLFSDLPPNAIERSRREASIRIDSENLLKMFGFIQVDEPGAGGEVIHHYHVASELLYGVKLSDLMEGRTTGPDNQPIERAEHLYLQFKQEKVKFAYYIVKNVLSGVMALHDKGYIHRDIDPSNIMLTADGKVKIIDFGIAKPLAEIASEKQQHLTSAGQFMGKAAYASPELVLGDISHQNETTDLYAVGILLYELLTGHLPFDGSKQEVLEQQLRTAPNLADIPGKKMRAVVAKALAKKQGERYHSAAEFRADLENAFRNDTNAKSAASTLTDAGSTFVSKVSGFPKDKLKYVIGAAAAVLAVVLLIILLPKKPKAPEVPEVPVDTIAVLDTVVAAPSIRELTDRALACLQVADSLQTGVSLLNEAMERDSTASAKAYAIMASLYSQEGAFVTLELQSPYEKDYEKAYKLSQKALELDPGCYYAAFEMAMSLTRRAKEIGVERNTQEAAQYLNKCTSLAEMYEDTTFLKHLEAIRN